MKTESFPQSQQISRENIELKQERSIELPIDYEIIKNSAISFMKDKISKLENAPGSFKEEISAYSQAADKLENDIDFIFQVAKINKWEEIRGKSENIIETDEKLAVGLARAARNLF